MPNPLKPQTLNQMKGDVSAYETANATITAHNQLLTALGPGAALSGSMFSTSACLTISAISGNIKRGKFSITVGTMPTTNPTINYGFPSGSFANAPFAQVVQSSGNGASGFTYTESATGMVITISGTPKPSEVYGFSFTIQD